MGFPCGRIPLSESARNPIGDEIEQKFAEKVGLEAYPTLPSSQELRVVSHQTLNERPTGTEKAPKN